MFFIINQLYDNYYYHNIDNTVVVSNMEANYAERASSEHISSQVNLKWSLLNTKICGIALLNGITLSSDMLGLITIAPLQWRMCASYYYFQMI